MDERQPLLANEDGRRNNRRKSTLSITPLPKRQMAVLCMLTFSEPMSEFIIFPFVNEMIIHVGATDDPQRIGFYSGFIESLLFFTAFCTSLFWGRLSDRIGRRPVLLFGVVGIITSAIAFGLSETFAAMVVSRSINGLLNGNSPVIRSVVAEITDKTNESFAFSLISLCWATAAMLAPALGGLLVRPAENIPSVFGKIAFFIRYPYVLPCLVGASVSLMGLITGIFWLKETLGASPSDGVDAGAESANAPDSASGYPRINNNTPIPVLDLLRIKNVRDTQITSWAFALASIGIDAVRLLWLYTPIRSGGIGLTTFGLGIVFSFIGIFNTIVLTLVFPPIQRRFGTRTIYIVAMCGHIAQVLLFPIVRFIAVHESGLHNPGSTSATLSGSFISGLLSSFGNDPDHGPPGPMTIAGIGAVVISKCVSDMAYACTGLLLNASAPNKASLGAVNGLMSMMSCLMRAIGPFASTSIFAATITRNLLGGNLFWIVLLAVCFLALYSATRLEKTPSVHELAAEETEEEDSSIQ